MMREKKKRRKRTKRFFMSVLCAKYSCARWKEISVIGQRCGNQSVVTRLRFLKVAPFEGVLQPGDYTYSLLPKNLQNLYLHTMMFSFGMKRLKALFRSSSDLSHLVMRPPLTERNIEFLASQSGWDTDDELTTELSRETKISEWLQLLP